jgi:asparagine synthase (glutamine-hydrolysing)
VTRVGDALLGHRRLSIIDLSPAASQPMCDVRGQVFIVYNGEIYNYRELRQDCAAAGLEFSSQSDTEVIVNLYLLEGERSFARLNGMFAFALLDTRSGEAYLVRDPMGIKPLYYGMSPEGLAFASELGALLASGLFPDEVDPAALQSYLQLDFVPSPMSMIRGIRKLPGGMLLHHQAGEAASLRAFSDLEREELAPSVEPDGDVQQFDRLIREVVSRQLLTSDVPVGVFLSGGIDSSIVARVATDIAGKISTFSVGFEEESFDERRHAELVARSVGADHHCQTLTAGSMLELFPRMAGLLSEPVADGSIFPTYLLARFTRQSVKVALSGDGADELFGGYPTHRLWSAGCRLASLPRPVRNFVSSAAHRLIPVSHANLSAGFKLKKFVEGLDRDPILQNQRWLGSFQPEEIPALLPGYQAEVQSQLEEQLLGAAGGLLSSRPLEAILRTDRRFYMQDQVLVKVDRASMANSLEVRVPFLDNEMVRFANGLPADRKIRPGLSKWLLRNWMMERFPRSIWSRPKKGFGAPLGQWFRGELRELVHDTLSVSSMRRDGFFDPAVVQHIVEEHQSGRRDHRKRILNLMMFTMWRQEIGAGSWG